MQHPQQPRKTTRYRGARHAQVVAMDNDAAAAADASAGQSSNIPGPYPGPGSGPGPHVPSRYHRHRHRPSQGTISSASSPVLSSSPAQGPLDPLGQSPPSPVVRTPPSEARDFLPFHQNTSRPVHPLASASPVIDPSLPHDVTPGPPAQPAQLWPPIDYSLDMPSRPDPDRPGNTSHAPQYDLNEWKTQERNDSAVRDEKVNFNDHFSHSQRSLSEKNRDRFASDDADNDDDGGRCFVCFRFCRKKHKSAGTGIVQSIPAEIPGPGAFIKQGGGGIVPGTDAPKSAANAGERNVQIYYNDLSMQFPVGLETTPSDLLRSAADCFARPFDPEVFALIEHFSKIGIQRPLRRYEHVRNVINSWDSDNNNRLIIKSAGEIGADPSVLHASTVARDQPPESSFDLLYSQKPGKWSQRHVTIRSDGQVLSTKKPGAKDTTNICHLSDFDVYTPTPEALKQKLKPPKGHCIAIKSQQPTILFEAKENFVHFFSTSDPTIAVRFYLAIHAWRSWYLVTQLGEGKKTPQPPPHSLSRKENSRSDADAASQQASDTFTVRRISVPRNPSVKDKRRPAQAQLSDNEPLANIFAGNVATVAPSGVTGRSQSMRQPRTTQAARVVSPSENAAVSARPGTSDGPSRRQSPPPQSAENADLGRSASKRRPPKPLIDLTPTYRPPPQHVRKGRGVKIDGGLLVDAATTPADPINAPPAVDWRGMNGPAAGKQHSSTSASDDQFPSRTRTGSTAARRPSAADERAMSMKTGQLDQDAFVRGGLVNSVPPGGPGQPLGRGVMQGSGAKGPMIDLSEPSQYVPGSLLARQENKNLISQ